MATPNQVDKLMAAWDRLRRYINIDLPSYTNRVKAERTRAAVSDPTHGFLR